MDTVFQIESFEKFQDVSQQILTSLYYSQSATPSLHLDAEVISLAKYDLNSIISSCNFDIPKIIELFENKGWQPEKVKCFGRLLDENKSNILSAALNHYTSSYCETVINFDWLVKYILGTSEMKTLKFPLLQLIMSTLNKNGRNGKVVYDINKDMLTKLIHTLENIQ